MDLSVKHCRSSSCIGRISTQISPKDTVHQRNCLSDSAEDYEILDLSTKGLLKSTALVTSTQIKHFIDSPKSFKSQSYETTKRDGTNALCLTAVETKLIDDTKNDKATETSDDNDFIQRSTPFIPQSIFHAFQLDHLPTIKQEPVKRTAVLDNVIESLRRMKEQQHLNELKKLQRIPHSISWESMVGTSEKSSISPTGLMQPQGYKCRLCEKTPLTQSAYQRHMRSHRQKSFHPCEYCGKDFRDRCTLLTHVRTHTGEKPYTCQTCGAKFRQSGTLRRHTKIHTGDKPYKCECCGKQFRHSSTLIIHKRIHTGENPHQCLICLKRFRQSGHLQKHIMTHEISAVSCQRMAPPYSMIAGQHYTPTP